jgi:hypothetical protein
MKTVKLIFLGLCTSFAAWAQNDFDGITVCHTSATEKFALFASSKEFNMMHPNPLPYVHQSETGKMITLKTADGKDANGYVLMAKKKTNNWIFVFQEWWGLNDHIKRESEKLYNDLGNVNVLAHLQPHRVMLENIWVSLNRIAAMLLCKVRSILLESQQRSEQLDGASVEASLCKHRLRPENRPLPV